MGPASRVSATATGSLRPSLTLSSTLSPTATTFVPNSVLDHRLNHLSVTLHHLHHLVYFLLHIMVYQLPPAQPTTVGHTTSVPPVSSCEEIPNNSPVGNACRGHHRMSVVHGLSTPLSQPPTDNSAPSPLTSPAPSTSSPSPPPVPPPPHTATSCPARGLPVSSLNSISKNSPVENACRGLIVHRPPLATVSPIHRPNPTVTPCPSAPTSPSPSSLLRPSTSQPAPPLPPPTATPATVIISPVSSVESFSKNSQVGNDHREWTVARTRRSTTTPPTSTHTSPTPCPPPNMTTSPPSTRPPTTTSPPPSSLRQPKPPSATS